MTLTEFVAALRKRWPYIVLPVILFALAAGVSAKLATPLYTSTASWYYSLPVSQNAADLYQGSNYTQQQLGSFAALATKPIVLDPVIDELGLDTTPLNLSRSVKASTSADQAIIDISVTSADPERAAAIANAVSVELGRTVKALSPRNAETDQPSVNVTQVAEAAVPQVQSSPNARRDVLAALLAGLMVGVLLALAREKLDTRVRGEHDLPEGVSVLGRIPFERRLRGRAARETYATRGEETDAGFASRGEAFRKLRTSLRFLDVDNPVKVVTMTSSVAGEGKSRTSLDLAKALADDGQRVLLVDADMRRPRVADYLSIEGAVGLVDVLAGEVPLVLAVQRLSGGKLDVLPSGSTPPNPSELLGSHAMGDLIGVLRDQYDLVLIDAPPLLPVTDALIAGVKSDGVLVVVRHGRTTRAQFAEAIGALYAVEARVLGAVINMVPRPRFWQRQSEYAYYTRRTRVLPGSKTLEKTGEILG